MNDKLNKFTCGSPVKFLLDGKREGQGIIRAIYSHTLEVELTAPCKEFDTGVVILVDYDEIVNN